MSLVANVFVLVCVIIALTASIEIYRMVSARSIALLIAAWGYMLLFRLALTIDQLIEGNIGWVQSHSAWFLIVFYILVSSGMVTLMYSLRNPLNREWEDHGKDRL